MVTRGSDDLKRYRDKINFNSRYMDVYSCFFNRHETNILKIY